MTLNERAEAKAVRRYPIYLAPAIDPKTGRPNCQIERMIKETMREDFKRRLLNRYNRIYERNAEVQSTETGV